MKTFYQPFKDFIDLFYPRICPACQRVLNQNEHGLCLHCLTSLPKTYFHLLSENPAEKLFWGRIKVEKAASFYYFTKHGHIQNLLHNIKYKGLKDIATEVGRLYGLELKQTNYFNDADFIVPVPLHPKKLKARGYNQAEYFAKGLSESLGIPLSVNNLVRTIHTATQTNKSRFQRWQNVSSIFHVNDPESLRDKHLVVVDDVITTGSTIESSFSALEGLNCRFSVATIAFASN